MAVEKNQLQAAQASNRDIPAGPPSARQDCNDVVNISIFFDGTGNNKDVDEKLKKWANPARMWQAAQLLADTGTPIYPIYVSGVGTPFNGKATDWLDHAETIAQDNIAGGAGGAGGTRRTEFAKDNVNQTLRRLLLENARKLNLTTATYAKDGKSQSLGELSRALASHRLIKMVNLSLIGFSRGAALARAFSNDFLSECKTDAVGKLSYQGLPIRLHFMGLFDTVASFGGPAANMDSFFSEKNLKVSGAVERCVHYVAAHELRFSFPVDLIRQHGQLMPNWTETVYPGVHSDVGGGYEPIDQGRSNNYALIPLREMLKEAVRSGVRLPQYDQIRQINQTLFAERFEVKPETEVAYNRYMRSVPAVGPVEQQVISHMKALYSAYGTMSRNGVTTPDNLTGAGKYIGHKSMAREVQALRKQRMGHGEVVTEVGFVQFSDATYSQTVQPESWQLQAWDLTASNDILALVSKYVHDSKAGFLYGIEPFSYFRPRGITESSRNVMAEGVQWLDKRVEAAKDAVFRVYATAQGVVVERWTAGVKVASTTYQVGEKIVVDTIDAGHRYAVEVYQTRKNIVVTRIDESEKVIINSVDTLQQEMSSALAAIRQRAINAAKQMQQGASSVADVVGNFKDSGMQAVEDKWSTTKTALGF